VVSVTATQGAVGATEREQARRGNLYGVLRRLRWSLGRRRESRSREGVYTAPERSLHYVRDDGERTLCGRSVRDLQLHRWASQWSLTEVEERCKRCDGLVGPRGAERHGPTTEVDILLFGLAPPWLSAAEIAAFKAEHARDEARFWSAAPAPGVTFKDPPFELATDPHRIRGTLEPSHDRVINEIYAQVRPGLRWHRIVALYQTSDHEYLAKNGRTFEGACTYGVRELEPDLLTNELKRSRVSTVPPPANDMCQACVKSLKRGNSSRSGRSR
jgi:hypothetical protein